MNLVNQMTSRVETFVAVFDVLGFKNLRRKRGTDGLHRLYERFLGPAIEHAAALESESVDTTEGARYIPKKNASSLDFNAVSDTVFIFATGATASGFASVVLAAHKLTSMGFAGHRAPLRGAIGFGDLVRDSKIFLGSAIEDGYWHQAHQAWSGCCLSKSCEAIARARGYLDGFSSNILVEYDIPYYDNPHSGPGNYYSRRGVALNWASNLYDGASEKGMEPSEDPHARRIFENTAKFEGWVRDRAPRGLTG